MIPTDDLTVSYEEILKGLKLLITRSDTFEIRALHAKTDFNDPECRTTRTYTGIYDGLHLEDAAKDILLLTTTGEAKGVFWTINNVSPDQITVTNSITGAPGNSVSDENIVARNYILVDLDPVREANTNSTTKELQAAGDMAMRIRSTLNASFGFGLPVVACSGNGIHLLYPCRLRNTAASTRLVSAFLKKLSTIYSNDEVKVDVTVYNASRISKVYGTMVRKGPHSKERPQRVSRIRWEYTPVKTNFEPLSITKINAFLNADIISVNDALSLQNWLAANGSELPERSNEIDTNDKVLTAYRFKTCPTNDKETPHAEDGRTIIFQMFDGRIGYHCPHDTCKNKDFNTLCAMYGLANQNGSSRLIKQFDKALSLFFIDRLSGNINIDDDLGIRELTAVNAANIFKAMCGEAEVIPIERLDLLEVTYDPNLPHGRIPNKALINRYKTPNMLVEAQDLLETGITAEELIAAMPLTWNIINNLLRDESQRNYMLHFLSATLKGYKLNVGIVLLDGGGTGKSLVLEYSVGTALGSNFYKFGNNELHDQFKGWLENKQFLLGEEIASNKDARDSVSSWLKDFTTGKDINIRRMRTDSYLVKNTANMILCSNLKTPIYINDIDRRWNVFGSEANKAADCEWWKPEYTTDTVRNIIYKEQLYFLAYLFKMDTDLGMLSDILDTPNRHLVVELQRSSTDEMAIRLHNKDAAWFTELLECNLDECNKACFSIPKFSEIIAKGGPVANTALYQFYSIVFKQKRMDARTFSQQLGTNKLVEKLTIHNAVYWAPASLD